MHDATLFTRWLTPCGCMAVSAGFVGLGLASLPGDMLGALGQSPLPGVMLVGGLVGLCALAMDMVSRGGGRRAAEAPRLPGGVDPEVELRAVLSSMHSLLAVVDAFGTVRRVLPTRFRIPDSIDPVVEGKPVAQLLPRGAALAVMRMVRDALRLGDSCCGQFEVRTAGARQLFDATATPLCPASVLVVARDVTEARRFEEELQRRTFFDNLTGLPNRALFMDRLGRALDRCQRDRDKAFAVLSVDMDRFKVFSDTYGPGIADELLRTTGDRIRACVRSVDTVGRFGGDEFFVLLDEVGAQRETLAVVGRILDALNRPIEMAEAVIDLQASVGVVFSDPAYSRPEDIVRDSTVAVRRAKTCGGGRCQVFQSAMHEQARRRLELEAEMRLGLSRKEFELWYQPIVALDDGRMVGMEALARWRRPRLGMVSPGEFIPLAEETGLVVPLGRQVLDQACRFLADLEAEGLLAPDFTCSVNLSARQFEDMKLTEHVQAAVSDHGVAAGRLTLEITETVFMGTQQAAGSQLATLKSMGHKLSMDDFGAGYSSLSYLYSYPFDTLKIDKSFIARLGEDPQRIGSIILAVLRLAEALGLAVIAEGLEDEERRARLRQMGCKLGQGFLFSRPVPAGELRRMLVTQGMGFAPPADQVHAIPERC